MTTDSQDCYSRAALSEPGMAVQAATTTVSPPHHPVLSLPHQPLRSCAAEAPGIERHTALNSIFFFCCYHAYSPITNYHHPVHQKFTAFVTDLNTPQKSNVTNSHVCIKGESFGKRSTITFHH